jgi:transposase-like protein
MRTRGHSLEMKERAVLLVFENQDVHESQWATISSFAGKIGCTPETLRNWVRQSERDVGKRPGRTTGECERPKQLERENRELKRANQVLRITSAFVAQAELDRRPR